ncbi:Dabb family protein [Arthrobacter sp. MA-N2]|uniref:Dabb family protein n=1 Tax=Arthrobacter sp. MA-N2 TaxID=1101188 RepID=UPI0004B6000D|nr:Dabb family protein [Arthrobacter sp. MA-N2]
MISHLAIVEFSEECNPEQIDDLVARIRALRTTIPNVRSLEAGVASTPDGGRLHRLALVATFDSVEDLTTYSSHPKHLEVSALVKELGQSVSGADIFT